jgi:hypothetical protein
MDRRHLERRQRLQRDQPRLHQLLCDAPRRHAAAPSSEPPGPDARQKAGPVWTGETSASTTRCCCDPLKWQRPRRIFVCAHGDLFHDSVPDAVIDQVFAVMALAPQHQFQVLTKRAAADARLSDGADGNGRRRPRQAVRRTSVRRRPRRRRRCVIGPPGRLGVAAAERLAGGQRRRPGARRRTHSAAARHAGGGALAVVRTAAGAGRS